MKQQCPKCGNWVVGTEKKSLAKRGIRKGIGLIPIVGQLVDAFDSGYQLVSGESAVNKLIDKVDSQFRDIPYEYNCPNCGYSWVSTIQGEEGNLATKEQYLFSSTWDSFLENSEEILSSEKSVDDYISQLEGIDIKSPIPKSEFNFLLAWVSYLAIETNKKYCPLSQKYINRAIKELNDQEYQLFALMVENKKENRDVGSITRNAIKLFKDLNQDNLLLKESYYRSELDDAITEQTIKYRKENFWGEFLIAGLPLILCGIPFSFIVYKYINYETDNWWIFSWYPIYWMLMIPLGAGIFYSLLNILSILFMNRADWYNKMVEEYEK